MGTKDLTHEALFKALSENTPLTTEQRAALLSSVADDQHWQRVLDQEMARLKDAMAQVKRERAEVLMALISLAKVTEASATISQGQEHELGKAWKVIEKCCWGEIKGRSAATEPNDDGGVDFRRADCITQSPAEGEQPQRYSPTGEGGMEIDSLGGWVKYQPQPKGLPSSWTDEQIDAVWGRYDQGYDTRRALIGRILAAAQAPAPGADDAKDAARYRWLRDRASWDQGHRVLSYRGAATDAAVDATMGSSQPPVQNTEAQR